MGGKLKEKPTTNLEPSNFNVPWQRFSRKRILSFGVLLMAVESATTHAHQTIQSAPRAQHASALLLFIHSLWVFFCVCIRKLNFWLHFSVGTRSLTHSQQPPVGLLRHSHEKGTLMHTLLVAWFQTSETQIQIGLVLCSLISISPSWRRNWPIRTLYVRLTMGM